MFQAERSADDVDVEHAAQLCGLDVRHQRGDLDAGVVDENVESTERVDRCLHRGGPIVFLGDVELHEADLGATGRQLASGVAAERGQHVADHHRRTGFCQRLRHAFAEAARATGDQCLAAGQVELLHACLLLCLDDRQDRGPMLGVVWTTVKN
jgi:hypothetical protein